MTPRRARVVFALVVAACLAGIAGWTRHAWLRAAAQVAAGTQIETVALQRLPVGAGSGRGGVALVRHTVPGPDYGRLALASLDAPAGVRGIAALACERVHYAAGSGLCLTAHRAALTRYEALLFDDALRVRARLPLPGPPSRARVSPDGRLAAFTTFVVGHAYAEPGFGTRTTIVDAHSGAIVAGDLEDWPVIRDDVPFKRSDFNFWGVTFDADGDRFLATLAAGGETYLVQGRLSQRSLRVLARNVECPSLSPDGRRVAFKRREPTSPAGRVHWRIAVMALSSGAVRVLPGEPRSVDDQLEWRGDGELLYGLTEADPARAGEVDVWSIRVDGDPAPRRLLRFASSPAALVGAGR